MSDAQTKKKVEFKNLNLDNITTPTLPEKKVDSATSIKEGYWLYGKPLADITLIEFKEWIREKIPSATSWEDAEIDTLKKKEKIITSLSENYNGLLYLPKPKIKPKQYKH